MWFPASRAGVVLAAILAAPALFIAILFCSASIEKYQESRRESQLIRNQEPILERWRRDSRVHSARLGRDPKWANRLLVQLDVDDKATCEAIVHELVGTGIEKARLLPNWQFTIRNGEKYEIDYGWGIAAEGIGNVLEGMQMMMISAGISIVIAIMYIIVGFSMRNADRRLEQS